MKWFYLISTGLVALLAVSPFALLKKTDIAEFDGLIVQYETYGSKVRSIDPATAGDNVSAAIQGNFYESLYAYHFLKRPIEIVPKLAEDLPEVSDDLLTYTIHIKPGVKYHRNECLGLGTDGEPLTRTVRAEDFVTAIKRIADYHINSPLAMSLVLEKIQGLEDYRLKTSTFEAGDFSRYDLTIPGVSTPDEYTLQIRLRVPFPQLVYVLAMNNFAPIPRELIDFHLASQPDGRGGREPIPMRERSAEIYDHRFIVSTGPYYLHTWERGSRIILKANPEFREEYYPSEGSPGDEQQGLLDDAGAKVPFIDVRYLTFVEEANPGWMLFLTKQADTSGIPSEVFGQVISRTAELTEQFVKQGIRLLKYTQPTVYWLAFNMDDPVVGKSKSLRQALSLSLDTRLYIDVLMNGRGIPATTFIPSDFEGHDQAISPYAKFDLALARIKVDQARRELVEAGAIRPDQPITITLDAWSKDEFTRRMAEFISQQFAQIGVNLNVEMNDWPTLQEKVEKKQCQMYTMGWGADYPDPENFLQLYYTPNIVRGTNNTNYSNGEFDALYEKTSGMLPSPERTELYVRMLKILNEDCPNLLLSEPVQYVLVHPWVFNVKPHPYGYGNVRYLRIDPELRRRMGGR